MSRCRWSKRLRSWKQTTADRSKKTIGQPLIVISVNRLMNNIFIREKQAGRYRFSIFQWKAMSIEDEIRGHFRNSYHKGLINLIYTAKQMSYEFVQSLKRHGLTDRCVYCADIAGRDLKASGLLKNTCWINIPTWVELSIDCTKKGWSAGKRIPTIVGINRWRLPRKD